MVGSPYLQLSALSQLLRRVSSFVRFWCGMRVAAPDLESGKDETIAAFYKSRITDCTFLADQEHYEYPRARWILDRAKGGRLLEIGCGNGGMTRMLALQVAGIVALDVSAPSLDSVDRLGLDNVRTEETLVEQYEPSTPFEWIVISEVLEHVRKPQRLISTCLQWLSPGGSLLVTTPNGHWESDEHLQEFTLENFSRLLLGGDLETAQVGYCRDGRGRRRWLVGQAFAPAQPPVPDEFHDRRAVARARRLKTSR